MDDLTGRNLYCKNYTNSTPSSSRVPHKKRNCRHTKNSPGKLHSANNNVREESSPTATQTETRLSIQATNGLNLKGNFHRKNFNLNMSRCDHPNRKSYRDDDYPFFLCKMDVYHPPSNERDIFYVRTRKRKDSLWIQLSILILFFLLPCPGFRSEVAAAVSSGSYLPPRPLPVQQQQRQNASSLSSLTAGFSIPGLIGNANSGSSVRFGGGTTSTTTTWSTSPPSGGEALVDDDYPFENNTFSNATVPLGDSAFLKCTVKNLGEREVFWIRRRDMHIISVGKNVYTNDERFHILNFEGSDDWTLQIKYVQKRDNGTYECQVSTGKGIASYAVHVFVAVPEAFILGNGEYHIQEGSTINLVCIVEKSPKPPDYIFWYHNERMINYDKDRNLRIQTETGSKTHSRLIIDNAQVSDSGNYTCHISNADPASTLVYISQGDKMAAIQRRKSAASMSSNYYTISDYFPLLLHQIFCVLLILINY
ncbi:uncharacterized protein LOC110853104 isoform X2 [Folsomia candida]|uniref:uncharacterized protein LOC110853104 isoform X2 n=1 Tax=Folsomia candida TaxID=158441 RepID=UPI0016050A28|nr:uncharacterized protein LOC110853104 isoform X2 [Folsomia candida]